jgi:hypothetical protein
MELRHLAVCTRRKCRFTGETLLEGEGFWMFRVSGWVSGLADRLGNVEGVS